MEDVSDRFNRLQGRLRMLMDRLQSSIAVADWPEAGDALLACSQLERTPSQTRYLLQVNSNWTVSRLD